MSKNKAPNSIQGGNRIGNDLLVSRIKNYILEHDLKSGDSLPTEQEMATHFGVSRSSFREALSALNFLGVINSMPRRGLALGNVSIGRIAEYMGFHLVLCNYPKHILLQVRLVIETGILPFVAEKVKNDSAMYEKLRFFGSVLDREKDLEIKIENDIVFHKTLFEAGDVKPIVVFNDLLQAFFSDFRNITVNYYQKALVNNHNHVDIVDALHHGDIESARSMVYGHFEGYKY